MRVNTLEASGDPVVLTDEEEVHHPEGGLLVHPEVTWKVES